MVKSISIKLVIFLILFSGCGRDKITGEPPVESLEIGKRDMRVILLPGNSVKRIQKVSVFGNFHPSLNLYEAEKRFGKPDNFIQEKENLTYSEYILPRARVRVYKEFYQTEYETEITNWLVAFPRNISVDDYIIKQIAKHIDVKNLETIYIMNSSKQEFLTIYLSGNRVTEIAWLNR